MKKINALLAASVMAASIMACGIEADEPEAETPEVVESAEDNAPVDNTDTTTEKTEDSAKDEAKDSALAAPTVKDGVKKQGPEGQDVYFEWNSVDGADGYEISVKSKYCEEQEYTEDASTYETTDNFYTVGAQDDFDFIIKVRAYKGEGANRTFSEWSTEAKGATY
ncbi:MAG: hypothetical protein IKO79_04585 [Butyrivibrio sp.]|nr:hypothetical protein [Butyrivibrio sp.]